MACDQIPFPRGEPITGLPAGEWTWVDFPDAHCMNGSSTGIGISVSPNATARLAIYLEGGGACFNALSCSMVANPDGYDGSRFRAPFHQIFDRANADNPVRDWTFVYVPYCTGDVHAGTNPDGFEGREQVGFRNVTEYLERLVPTFPDLEMVLLTGSSAGGFGAFANYDQVQRAFGCTPVHMLDDSGPAMSDMYMRPCIQELARDLWQFDFPDDCTQCTQGDGGGLSNLWDYLARKYPDRRFGLSSYDEDTTIRLFFGFGLDANCSLPSNYPGNLFREGLIDLRDNRFAQYPNIQTFYAPGASHTFLGFGYRNTTVDGVVMTEWLRQLIDGDPAWRDVGP